jgi:hypothetical protein
MGQILHGSARTTEAVRREIQHSQESLRALAKRHGINQKSKRGQATAGYTICASGAFVRGFHFHGMSSSQRDAGQLSAILAMTSAI